VPDTRIEIAGVPNRRCVFVSVGVRNPSCAIANGMRVLASTVLFRSATLANIAAMVIQPPSHGPPIKLAAVEKYPACQSCQLLSAASDANVGRKYVAIDMGTTMASASG
jgi:hypothetical protein